ncbi:hypothetical protein FMM05_07630 [Flavobacterium zepuense]|uniref:Lipoprotein n=1 Tax=Flavobacterium zepuense TaxID=2593302 RepID=A0A552V3Y7_9FLAO|nr:hypothetical protein [Flavobacterium zepuense]TRW25168.1 hypothetical protein FMM05_07630 [Flavobacterium zepuense]
MSKLLLFVVSLFILSCNSKTKPINESKSKQTVTTVKLTGKQIADGLDKRHFFDLTDAIDITETKLAVEESYNTLHFFDGKMKGETTQYTDNRFYVVDCEELFEIGGLTKYLDVVKISFEKLDLKLEYSNEKIIQAEKHWKHTIILNGKQYTAYDEDFNDTDWDLAFINFIEMLNDQLSRQGSNEAFYPINSGNGGRMVLLTPEQFQFVQANFPSDENLPKSLNEWRTMYKF